MTRLGVPKGGFRLMEAWEDWYVLEGGTNWAQVEGDASEWRAIAAGIRSGQTVRFKRCAVSVGETHIGLESPRNSRGDDDLVLIEKRLGEDLVAHILAVVGPGPEPEPARPPLPPVAPGAPELVRRLLEPQPSPVGDGDSVTDAALAMVTSPIVRELLLARREQGLARYGTELRSWNGRNPTADLAQELTDALLYATQREMQNQEPYPGHLFEVLESALHRVATDAAGGADPLTGEPPPPVVWEDVDNEGVHYIARFYPHHGNAAVAIYEYGDGWHAMARVGEETRRSGRGFPTAAEAAKRAGEELAALGFTASLPPLVIPSGGAP